MGLNSTPELESERFLKKKRIREWVGRAEHKILYPIYCYIFGFFLLLQETPTSSAHKISLSPTLCLKSLNSSMITKKSTMVLPLFKLGTLALRTISKPIANRLKKEAGLHPTFRQFIINIAQVFFFFSPFSFVFKIFLSYIILIGLHLFFFFFF